MNWILFYIPIYTRRTYLNTKEFLLVAFFADPPKVRLSLGSSINPESISEGNDVYMDCEIRANPKAYKVEWSHNVRNNN